jgi:hypothetical protein
VVHDELAINVCVCESSNGIFLEMGLLKLSKIEYALIMVMFTKNFFLAIGLNLKCV